MTEPKILLALAQQLSHYTFCAGGKTNPKKFTRCMSPSKGEGPGDTFPSQIQEFIDHNKHLAEVDIV